MKTATILVLAILLPLLAGQSTQFIILPDATYNSTEPSAQACYANCQACQTLSNQCEECYAPYFTKAQDGSCQLAASYTVPPPPRS
jgi:hypothetical protein